MVERDYLDNLKKYMRTIEDKIKVIKIDDKKIKALKEILGHFVKCGIKVHHPGGVKVHQ